MNTLKQILTLLKPILFEVELINTTEIVTDKNCARLPFDRYTSVRTWPKGKNEKYEIPYMGGEKYVLVTNNEVLNPLVDVLTKNPKFKNLQVRVSNVNNEVFTVDFFNMPPDKRKNDYIAPVIRFVNSYNGKVKAKASAALYRIDKEGKQSILNSGSVAYEFKHHSDEGAVRIAEISESVDKILEDFATVNEQVEKLKAIEVSEVTKTINDIVPDAKHYPKKAISHAIELVTYESVLFGVQPNLWLIYTALAQAVKKESLQTSLNDYQKEVADAVAWENTVNFADGQTKKKKTKK
jgi:tetrahydromethanopterin S-methyltransferase subunit B